MEEEIQSLLLRKSATSRDKIPPSRKVSSLLLLLSLGAIGAIFVVLQDYINSNEYKATKLENFDSNTGYKLDQCHDFTGSHKVDKSHCCSNTDFPVLGGIDVVNLFFQHAHSLPVVGKDAFSATLATNTGEYTFLFVDELNRDKFEEDPWKFTPAYGGFDSCGIGLEERSRQPQNRAELGPPVDLSKWAIVDDRLYFFGGTNPRDHFLAETTAVKSGDDNWKNYFDGQLEDGVFNTNCFRRQTYFDLLMGIESLYTCRDEHRPRKLLDDDEDAGSDEVDDSKSLTGSASEGSSSPEEGRPRQGSQRASEGNPTGAGTEAEGRSRQGQTKSQSTEDNSEGDVIMSDHLKELVGLDLSKLGMQIQRAIDDISLEIQDEKHISQQAANFLAEQVILGELKLEEEDLQNLLSDQAKSQDSSASQDENLEGKSDTAMNMDEKPDEAASKDRDPRTTSQATEASSTEETTNQGQGAAGRRSVGADSPPGGSASGQQRPTGTAAGSPGMRSSGNAGAGGSPGIRRGSGVPGGEGARQGSAGGGICGC